MPAHTLTFEMRRQLHVHLIGAGGNGSKLLVGLKNLHLALQGLGCQGLHVVLTDGDTVSESNLARQAFFPSDVGLSKAVVLINRFNLSYGLAWQAYPHSADTGLLGHDAHVVISCVDTRVARRMIQDALTQPRCHTAYWLDLGNTRDTGQFVLGCPRNAINPRSRLRLRTAAELFPELVSGLPEDAEPSCSTFEALERQDLFVNDVLVSGALNLLWRLLRYGEISYHGGLVNVQMGVVRPLPIQPRLWQTFSRRGQRVVARGTQPLFYHSNGTRKERR
jgi:PRTRC genetic system ThiF family protein